MRRLRKVHKLPQSLSAQSLGRNLFPSIVIPFKINRLKSIWLIYTSLLLDTQTGRIWQVQIGIGDNSDRMRSVLSDTYYSYDEYKVETDYETALKEWEETPEEDREDWYTKPELEFYQSFLGKIGQYKLYPTENMYNFLMVNTETGLTYQVQWNIDKDLRFIQLIW